MSHTIPDDQLLAFAAGELAPDDAAAIRTRLTADPDAARRVSLYKAVATTHVADAVEDAPRAVLDAARSIFDPAALPARPVNRWWETLDRLVASLLFDSRAKPALAGVRGVGSAFQMTFVTDATEVDLQFEPRPTDGLDPIADQWEIIGQVAAPQITGVIAFAFVPLTSDGSGVDGVTDERGTLTCVLAPGRYDLHLDLNGADVVIAGLDIP